MAPSPLMSKECRRHFLVSFQVDGVDVTTGSSLQMMAGHIFFPFFQPSFFFFFFVFFFSLFWTVKNGRPAGDDRWDRCGKEGALTELSVTVAEDAAVRAVDDGRDNVAQHGRGHVRL